MIQGLTVHRYEGDKRRPELLIDEATKHFLLENPSQNNMFNLTLSNFQTSNGLFYGRLYLGNSQSYENLYSVRIDYYNVGFIPTI